MSLSKYPYISLVAARSNLAYLGDVVGKFLFLGIVLYVFTCLWQLTYSASQVSSLAGLTLDRMIWYLVITESIILSSTNVSQVVDEDVRTGSLSVQLVRPVSYPLYRLWTTLGERVVRFGMNFVVGALVALLLVGPIAFKAQGALIFLCSLPLAFVLDFLCKFLIGLGAFWLEDTSGLLLLYSRITMILGGMLIPLELMPEFLRPLLKMLPFAGMVYGPARLFVQPDWNALFELWFAQVLSIACLSLLVMLVYNRALRRVFANGG